jgi:hypothetical protein
MQLFLAHTYNQVNTQIHIENVRTTNKHTNLLGFAALFRQAISTHASFLSARAKWAGTGRTLVISTRLIADAALGVCTGRGSTRCSDSSVHSLRWIAFKASTRSVTGATLVSSAHFELTDHRSVWFDAKVTRRTSAILVVSTRHVVRATIIHVANAMRTPIKRDKERKKGRNILVCGNNRGRKREIY